MANPSASTAPTPTFRARPRRSMSPRQLQAYLLARETLRRVRRSATPCVPRDPSTRASPARDRQPALGRT